MYPMECICSSLTFLLLHLSCQVIGFTLVFPNHKALCSMHYSSYIEMAANIKHVYLYGVLERGKKFWVNLYKKQRIRTGLSSEKNVIIYYFVLLSIKHHYRNATYSWILKPYTIQVTCIILSTLKLHWKFSLRKKSGNPFCFCLQKRMALV